MPHTPQWINESLIVVIAATAISILLYGLLMVLAKYIIPDRILSPKIVRLIVKSMRLPLVSFVVLMGLRTSVPAMNLSTKLESLIYQLISILIIATTGWVAIRIAGMCRQLVTEYFDVNTSDNLRARKIHTQIRVTEQIVVAVIFVISLSSILMTFDKVRLMGMSLLASAGVIGIILGFAAQKSISTLFAGIQIALTQPIRVDDVVVVEGEWGRIEEITLTYVVVKIWDLRRLILPITWFLEQPFQNWTRVSADILGTVFIYADYTVPVEAIRKELRKICETSPLWDKNVCGIQVTDSKTNTIEIRALVSSHNSSDAWDLRCLVREKLIEFLQKNYPDSLPKTRIEMNTPYRA